MNLKLESELSFDRTIKKRRSIGIISLIDVAFFLLIFFMVAGTIEQFEIIDIEPPKAESGEMLDKGQIIILLGSRGEIIMDDSLYSMSSMVSELKVKLLQNPDRVVTIKADASIAAATLVEVMDQVQLAGGSEVTIATDGAGE